MKRIMIAIMMISFSVTQAYAQESSDEKKSPPKEESPKATGEKSSDPCAVVTCANHGTCVVKEGDPICACDDGYEADPATGLSCRPIVAPLQAALVSEELSEQDEIEQALGARKGQLNAQWQAYKSSTSDGSFADYMYGSFTRKRTAGLVLLPLGAAATVGGVMLMVAGSRVSIDENDYETTVKAYAYGAAACFVVGGLFMITGGIALGKGIKGRKKIKRYMSGEKRADSEALRFAGVSPLLSNSGTPNGASLLFTF